MALMLICLPAYPPPLHTLPFPAQVRDHFEHNEEAKALLKQVKSFKVTK